MNEYEDNMMEVDAFEYFTHFCHEESPNSSLLSLQVDINNQPPPNPQIPNPQPEIKSLQDTNVPTAQPTQPPKVRKQVDAQVETALEIRNRYERVHQGLKDDTMELNINFKTILYSYLRELMLLNELSPEETQTVLQFGRRSPSFKSLLEFAEASRRSQNLRNHCQKLLESSCIVTRILNSRSNLPNKIQMLKYVQILRVNVRRGQGITRWKEPLKK